MVIGGRSFGSDWSVCQGQGPFEGPSQFRDFFVQFVKPVLYRGSFGPLKRSKMAINSNF